MGRRPKNYIPPHPPVLLKCVRCGQNKPEKEFYANKWSKVYVAQKRVPLCRDCIQTLFTEYSVEYGTEAALFLVCAELDIPYDKGLFGRITDKEPPFTMGKYFRRLQMKQYDKESFSETVTHRGQKCPKDRRSTDRLTELEEDILAIREDIQVIKVKLMVG